MTAQKEKNEHKISESFVRKKNIQISIFHLPSKTIHPVHKEAAFARLTMNTILIVMTNTNKVNDTILFAIPLTNSPIIATLDVNVMVGMTANGSCNVIIVFKRSFIPVKSSMLLKYARQNVGTMAIIRVIKTRFHRGHCKFKKPSITN